MSDELQAEYQFDYKQAKPNRFAASLKKAGRLVVLDPEVAAAFQQSDAVNAVLRSLLQTMPAQRDELAIPVERPAPSERSAKPARQVS